MLTALSHEGVRFYKHVQLLLDSFYPALLALTLGWSILRLAPASWGVGRWLLAATALPGMVFDYGENADVAAMLDLGPAGVTPAIVEAASTHSYLKAGATSLAMTLLLVLIAAWLVRRFGLRRAQ